MASTTATAETTKKTSKIASKTLNTRYLTLPHNVSLFVGAIVGALITFLTFYTAHKGNNVACYLLTGGGLIYSAPTIFDLLHRLTDSKLKSVGFVILMEGVMTFTNIPVLWKVTTAHIALSFLLSANAFMFAQIAANRLSNGKKKTIKKKTAKK